MFSELYKFSKLVMHLNSCSMNLGHDKNKHKHNNTQYLSLFQQFACIKKISFAS